MTSHEFAKILLELPDLPIYTQHPMERTIIDKVIGVLPLGDCYAIKGEYYKQHLQDRGLEHLLTELNSPVFDPV